MSVDATRWVWTLSGITSAQKLVLMSLADRADEHHCCYPSIGRLSADCCLGRRTVQRALQVMCSEDYGLVRVVDEKVVWTPGGRQVVPVYQLVGVGERHERGCQGDGGVRVTGASESPKGVSLCREGGVTVTQRGCHSDTQTTIEPPRIHQEPPRRRASARAAPAAAEPKRAKRRRRTAVPDGDVPVEFLEWAAEACPGFDAVAAWSEFQDFWRGDGGVKADWLATWRNEVRKQVRRGWGSGMPGRSSSSGGSGGYGNGTGNRESSTDRARRGRASAREWAERGRQRREQAVDGGRAAH